jgi:hypothetical protein
MVKSVSKTHVHDEHCSHSVTHSSPSSLYTTSTGEAPSLEEHKELLKDAGKLEFNIFKFTEEVGRDKAFILLPMHLTSVLKLDESLAIDQAKFVHFGQ